jgi:hypothetical protein
VSAAKFGNLAAAALALGTAVFFWSGEMQHRAGERHAAGARLNRRSDLSSGVGWCTSLRSSFPGFSGR